MTPKQKEFDEFNESNDEMLQYYRNQSSITDPSIYSDIYEDLPTTIPELCKIIQNVIIHIFWLQAYGMRPSDLKDQKRNINKELNQRSVHEKLSTIFSLKDEPLTERRKPNTRVLGNCRDYSVLLASILRYNGISARVRSGVSRYFFPPPKDFHEDHFICEYWHPDDHRWVMVDSQIDEIQNKTVKVKINLHDIPSDQFLNAGHAWIKFREGKVKPKKIGLSGSKWLGERFLIDKLIQDFACLNKVEVLAWETWGICDLQRKLKPNEYEELDKLASKISCLSDTKVFVDLKNTFKQNNLFKMPENYKPRFEKFFP